VPHLDKLRTSAPEGKRIGQRSDSKSGSAPENAEKFGTSHASAAPGAENERSEGDTTGCVAGQGTAPAALDDAELAQVLNRWATLPVAIRQAVLVLVRSSG
jgi:hypothetical protein